jgi:hypothetical protein
VKPQFPTYKNVKTDSLIPYARNSRTHSEQQISKIAASIKEFGFLNPVIIDGASGIVAGHGRVMAAQKLGLLELPVIEASHLSDAQRRAYVIADNRLALDAGWDEEMLRVEFAELEALDFNLELTGFTAEEINSVDFSLQSEKDSNESNYSTNIESPIYEIKGEKPAISELYDTTKTGELSSNIMKVDLPDDVRGFLMAAATRHTVFNYENIAEFYAHQDPDVQELMRQSALVIIDLEQAIENGFVNLSKNIEQIRQQDLHEDDDEQ